MSQPTFKEHMSIHLEEKKKKKKTTHFVHFLVSTIFILIFLNDSSSTKRSHQTDAPLSLTANEGLNFVPKEIMNCCYEEQGQREIYWPVHAEAHWKKSPESQVKELNTKPFFSSSFLRTSLQNLT